MIPPTNKRAITVKPTIKDAFIVEDFIID